MDSTIDIKENDKDVSIKAELPSINVEILATVNLIALEVAREGREGTVFQ